MRLDLSEPFLYIPMSELHAGQMLMNNKRPRILLIRFSSLGDLVLLTAAVDAIGEAFPGHDLHLATKEKYRELFENNRCVAKIHTLPTGAGFGDLIGLRRELAAEEYDILIDAHNVIRSNVLYRTLGARIKIQLRKDQIRKFSLINVNCDLYADPVSMKDAYLGLIDELDVEVGPAATRLDPSPDAATAAEALFKAGGLKGKSIVALAPGARWETKRWPEKNFIHLSQELESGGYGVLVVGGDSERELCGRVAGDTGAVNTCGRLSLMETAAALQKASVLVTNDSAPLHIAEAVGTPVVALFGPTVRQFGYFPLLDESVALEMHLDCRPCSRNGARPCRLESRICLEQIFPLRVLSTLKEILESTGEKK